MLQLQISDDKIQCTIKHIVEKCVQIFKIVEKSEENAETVSIAGVKEGGTSMEHGNHLEIRMFGKFEMIYNGQVLRLGHSQTTKAMKLLQLLLFYADKGLHRSQVIQDLFGVDAEGDIQTNLRVVVHNLRKILGKSGLPEGDYVVIESGVYRFQADFPINVDALSFVELLKTAKTASEEEKYQLLKEAFTLYKGHFLPEIYGEDWVVVNNSRFQNLYTECLENLIEIMRKQEDYQDMYKACSHAATLYPLDEWQVYQMEALVALGETKEALALYEKTTEMYFEELLMPPSDQMLECFQHMKDQLNMKTRDINEIQSGMEEKEFFKGAFFCQYPSFADSYRMMNRMMERSGQSVYLLMCTLHDEKEQIVEGTEAFKEISDKLFDSIQESLRRGDIFTKYNLKQYLVMLIGIRKEECSIVTSRIDSSFRKKCNNRNIKVQFHISSVAADKKSY